MKLYRAPLPKEEKSDPINGEEELLFGPLAGGHDDESERDKYLRENPPITTGYVDDDEDLLRGGFPPN